MGDHFLIIGATLLDTKGKPRAGLEPATSNPASIRHTRGGTARNVAENLGRFGAEVKLLSAVGDDHTGRQLVAQTAEAGVDVSEVQIISNQRTGSYIVILDDEGSLSVALEDVSIMSHISPAYLYQRRRLFRDACMVLFDGSLGEESIAMIVRLSTQYQVPLCADPSSARLAYKLRDYLPNLHLVVPNEVEAAALSEVDFSGFDPDASLEVAMLLMRSGVKTVIVTLSDFGLVYSTSDETGYIPARYSEFVDSTGTGDSVTAAVMFGMVNEFPITEAIRLGAAAASLTLQTSDTVVPDLSLDMLYDHLSV
ncbi:MAG: carbohydrate kinase family protein [Candidatus Promineifilaceae bacterium]